MVLRKRAPRAYRPFTELQAAGLRQRQRGTPLAATTDRDVERRAATDS
jgi:hypothetical protein